jgi:hypothetical protein
MGAGLADSDGTEARQALWERRGSRRAARPRTRNGSHWDRPDHRSGQEAGIPPTHCDRRASSTDRKYPSDRLIPFCCDRLVGCTQRPCQQFTAGDRLERGRSSLVRIATERRRTPPTMGSGSVDASRRRLSGAVAGRRRVRRRRTPPTSPTPVARHTSPLSSVPDDGGAVRCAARSPRWCCASERDWCPTARCSNERQPR